MRAPAIAILGVASYAFFLACLTPAAFLAARINGASGGQVDLRHASGTLWRGNAAAQIATPSGPFDLDAVEWSFAPSRLLAGRIAFDLKASGRGLEARGEIGRGFSDWQLRDSSAEAKASVLSAFHPLATTWMPEGRFLLAAPDLRWDRARVRGEASVEWREAAVSLSEVKPLGSYRLEARGEDSAAKLSLVTLQGPLKLSGQGRFTPPGLVSFSGEARGDKALEALLDLMGPRRPDGARSIEVRVR